MKCYVLTGISKAVIEEIVRGNIRNIELRSAHNVATALNVKIGDHVFLTVAKTHDLEKGVSGLIAEVTGKEVMSQSVFYSSPHYAEECEITVVRLKLLPKAVGRIIKLKPSEILGTREAEIVEVSIFNAR
ncbi:MAG: DUF473 domain-containing protein [Archaeoglobales archaeon]|nr:DUF473 domain-containing protein [Archaeoglobales archaeon]